MTAQINTAKADHGLLASFHRTATGLHDAGLMEEATLREFDPHCL